MCGIVGLIGLNDEVKSSELIKLMANEIETRGPDEEGGWIASGFSFWMKRLSIVDLDNGAQPIWLENGVGIIFNGEIYNHKELREELEQLGYKFLTNSDTEVILKLYDHVGAAKMALRMNGMFAICIYDPRVQKVYLIRDRFGVKPIYYANINNFFYFASEIKAIIAALEKKPDINNQSVYDYLTLRFVPGDNSIWASIKKVVPASYLEYDLLAGVYNIEKYWHINFNASNLDKHRDYGAEFSNLFHDSVKRRYLTADVPVGIFLSGGLDSSAIAAACVELGFSGLRSFSIGFDDMQLYSESEYALAVAEHLKIEHHHQSIGVDEFINFLPDFVRISDEPLADLASIPLYFLSKNANQHGLKVVLSGEGADEVFGGYNFQKISWILKRIKWLDGNPLLKNLISNFGKFDNSESGWLRTILSSNYDDFLINKKYHPTNYLSQQDKKLLYKQDTNFKSTDKLIESWFSLVSSKEPMDRLHQVYSGNWLTEDLLMKMDKMSMANSLEVREPYLDYDLVDWAFKLPLEKRYPDTIFGNHSKYIIRQYCRGKIPEAILKRPKRGFPVPSVEWLMGPLRGWSKDILLGPNTRIHALFDKHAISDLYSDILKLNKKSAEKLWLLIVLEFWMREWL